jgi:hypothetical protein
MGYFTQWAVIGTSSIYIVCTSCIIPWLDSVSYPSSCQVKPSRQVHDEMDMPIAPLIQYSYFYPVVQMVECVAISGFVSFPFLVTSSFG